METAEHSEADVSAPPPAAPRKAATKRLRIPTVILWLLVIGLVTSLVVAVAVAVISPAPPTVSPATGQEIAVQHAPQLAALPLGVVMPGCLDPRSLSDGMVLCPGDLDSSWEYGGGLTQPQGQGVPACANTTAGQAIAWVDVNNGLTNVHEEISTQPSAEAALATIARLAKTGGASLCTNLNAGAASRVTPLTVAFPAGAASGVAWSVPASGRSFAVVFVAVRQGVVRLDITELGGNPALPPAGVLQRVVNGAVARYLVG